MGSTWRMLDKYTKLADIRLLYSLAMLLRPKTLDFLSKERGGRGGGFCPKKIQTCRRQSHESKCDTNSGDDNDNYTLFICRSLALKMLAMWMFKTGLCQ